MIRKYGVALLASAAMALSLAACGSDDGDEGSGASGAMSADEIFAKYGQMSPDERDADLLEIAKTEGTLEHYSAWTFAEEQAKGFTKKYGIKVNVYSTDNDTVYQKIAQEHDAKQDNADVVDMGYLNMTLLDQAGVFRQDWVHGRDTEPISKGVFPGRAVAFVVAWNTDKVSDADAPTSIWDLANPKWKGKVSIEIGDYDWYAGLKGYYLSDGGMSESEFDSKFAAVVANSHAGKGHTALVTALGSGEDWLSATVYSQNVQALAEEGAPVAWQTKDGKAVQPIVVNPSGIGILTTTKHPATALLFADFLMSQEGQEIYKANEAIPADRSVSDLPADYITVSVPAEELAGNQEAQDTWDAIIRKAGQ